jgi:hypothetical protein
MEKPRKTTFRAVLSSDVARCQKLGEDGIFKILEEDWRDDPGAVNPIMLGGGTARQVSKSIDAVLPIGMNWKTHVFFNETASFVLEPIQGAVRFQEQGRVSTAGSEAVAGGIKLLAE